MPDQVSLDAAAEPVPLDFAVLVALEAAAPDASSLLALASACIVPSAVELGEADEEDRAGASASEVRGSSVVADAAAALTVAGDVVIGDDAAADDEAPCDER